jgi:FHA domain-containing protein
MVLLGFGGPTTDVRTPAADDTRPYGGPTPKQLFIALRVLHSTSSGQGLGGAVILRSGPKVSVGQQGCDLNFPTDKRLAARHFELNIKSSGLEIVETAASNGVFLRIRKATELKNGDELMAGEEVFRIEIG